MYLHGNQLAGLEWRRYVHVEGGWQGFDRIRALDHGLDWIPQEQRRHSSAVAAGIAWNQGGGGLP